MPMQSEKANVVHQPALPFAKVPALMQALRATPGKAARLLELLVLTATRTDAARSARLAEFDLAAGLWTVPANRMKALKRDHRIPLGPRAVEIVRELRAGADGELLFSGASGRPIGRNEAAKVLSKLLKAIGSEHAVPHGFRSCLKDWAHECRDYSGEITEEALGHRVKSSVERAYRRGDLFERRRVLMIDWENFCSGNSVIGAEVIKLRG
jgi:integrase